MDNKRVKDLQKKTNQSAWRVNPSQLSFSMGKPLTEEEFKSLCAHQNMTPHIHRVDSQKK